MKKTFFFFLLVITANFYTGRAQSIRKDYREFTAQEQADYVDAVNAISSPSNPIIQNIAAAHDGHFYTNIHTTTGGDGSQFLSWHRFFLEEVEHYIKTATVSSGYLAIPYWDWTTDTTRSDLNYWNNSFLKTSNFPNLAITRNLGKFPVEALLSNVNTILGNATFLVLPLTSTVTASNPDFSHKLEGSPHSEIHSYVGGTMETGNSPLDPIFFLHHVMVDKLWQSWEETNIGIQSIYPGSSGTASLVHFNTTMGYPFDVISNDLVDSRSLTRPAVAGEGRKFDVWFASNKKILLNGANGAAFICTDVSSSYLYRYTAAIATGASTVVGSMYVGDAKRDNFDAIVSDNKGGFEINSGVTCNFRSGAEILFLPGFEAKFGSIVEGKTISTPNGF